jgi:hypothetical protein
VSQTTHKIDLDTRLRTAFARVGQADAATFIPESGPNVSCTVIVRRGVSLQGGDSQVVNDAVTIECYIDQLGRAPDDGEQFTIGAETFDVDQIIRKDENSVLCLVTAAS